MFGVKPWGYCCNFESYRPDWEQIRRWGTILILHWVILHNQNIWDQFKRSFKQIYEFGANAWIIKTLETCFANNQELTIGAHKLHDLKMAAAMDVTAQTQQILNLKRKAHVLSQNPKEGYFSNFEWSEPSALLHIYWGYGIEERERETIFTAKLCQNNRKHSLQLLWDINAKLERSLRPDTKELGKELKLDW